MNVSASDFDCPLMVSAGRLGRVKDAFDKRDTFRRHHAGAAFRRAGDVDVAKGRAIMEAIAAEIHAAPSHLAGRLYPLAMAASVTLEKMEARRAALLAEIDTARAA